MRRVFFASAIVFALVDAAATVTRADSILYDTSTSPLHDNDGFAAAPQLDDVTFSSGPVSITGMNLAFWYRIDPFDPPPNPQPEDIDLVVTFWNDVNTAATGTTIVNTNSLGSFRRHIGLIQPGATGTVGFFSLPSAINVPDNTVGVQVNYVLTTTNTISDVYNRIATNLPTVGTTVDKYWNDSINPGGVFQGQDNVNPNPGTPNIHENLYLRLNGTVPEPSSLALLPGAYLLALSRRRRCRIGPENQ
jgi:hypothetical protein